MRWDEFRTSDNVEDRRGSGPGFGLPGGLGGRGNLGIGTIVVLGVLGYALGIDPRILIGGAEMLSGGGSSITQSAPQGQRGTPNDQAGRFVAAVLGNTEDVWKEILPTQVERDYKPPGLVMFSGATRSGCGAAQAAMGPFYCPLDQKVYIDLAFFDEMKRRFGGGGDFAYAYVIAHEVGHHVENQLGILAKVQQRQRSVSPAEANALSVRVELMADCLAGIWAFHSDQKWKSLEEGDIDEALKTASAIGDDRLQQASQGRIVPDSFTHGSAEQRTRWFMTGFKSGQIKQCNTFQSRQL